jgi:hypothetical protein
MVVGRGSVRTGGRASPARYDYERPPVNPLSPSSQFVRWKAGPDCPATGYQSKLLDAFGALRRVGRSCCLPTRRERRRKIRTVIMSVFVGIRFGQLGANPVIVSVPHRAIC